VISGLKRLGRLAPPVLLAKGDPVTLPDSSEAGLGSKLAMKYYLRQVRFLEGKLLKTADAILARSKAPPVIVIQSDEGFQANPDNTAASPPCSAYA